MLSENRKFDSRGRDEGSWISHIVLTVNIIIIILHNIMYIVNTYNNVVIRIGYIGIYYIGLYWVQNVDNDTKIKLNINMKTKSGQVYIIKI